MRCCLGILVVQLFTTEIQRHEKPAADSVWASNQQLLRFKVSSESSSVRWPNVLPRGAHFVPLSLAKTSLTSTMMMRSLLLLVSLLTAQAFQSPAFVGRRTSSALSMGGMAQPEVEVKTKVKTKETTKQKQASKQKAKTGDPQSRREEEFQDAPMFKLMLLEDDSYDAEHVVMRMCAILEDLDENAAATVFQQAMQEGKAMCGMYPFEIAELYKEQLIRSDPMIFADLEEE